MRQNKNANYSSQSLRNRRSRWPLLIIALLIVALAAGVAYHFLHKTPTVSTVSKPVSSLPHPKAAKPSTAKNTEGSSLVNQGTDTDKNGQVSSSVPSDQSKWTISESGKLTVKSPGQNTTFHTGDELAGTSTTDNIHYRLIDSQVGVISEGQIKIVNGNFAAAINFNHTGSNGRLDAFSTDSTGREYNEVQIPVHF